MEQVAAILTENAVATVPEACGRTSCTKIIQPGEHRYFVRNALDPQNLLGKWVCLDCFKFYRNQRGTTIRSVQNPSLSTSIPSTPNAKTIRQNINEAQRQGGHTPQGQVTAVGAVGPYVAAPHVLQGTYGALSQSTTSPIISNGRIVTYCGDKAQSQNPYSSAYPPTPLQAPRYLGGYSPAHAQHAQQTKLWAQNAYKGIHGQLPGHQLTINIEVCEPESNAKGEAVRIQPSIRETITVPLTVSEHDLHLKIKDAVGQRLMTHLQAFGVKGDLSEMEVRETTKNMWASIHLEREAEYFQGRFMVSQGKVLKSGQPAPPTFQAPPKPLSFSLLLSPSVWSQLHSEDSQHELQIINKHSSQQVAIPTTKTQVVPHKRRFIHTKIPTTIESDDDDFPEYVLLKRPRQGSDALDQKKSSRRVETNHAKCTHTSNHQSTKAFSDITPSNYKEKEGASDSKIEIVEKAPMIAPSTATVDDNSNMEFVMLDEEDIRHALQKGGESIKIGKTMDVGSAAPFASESIIFCPLPELSFRQLVHNPNITIINETPDDTHFHAHIAYNPSHRLGKGAFKTATSAFLEFDGARRPQRGLGSRINGSGNFNYSIQVALKRPFIEVQQPSPALRRSKRGATLGCETPHTPLPVVQSREARLPFADELEAVSKEALVLIWADALLRLSYEFVDKKKTAKLSNQAEADPIPLFIQKLPRFRFVQAAVAVVPKPIETGRTGIISCHRAVYLLEEMLPGTYDDFVKYIHNNDAVPLLDPQDPDYDLAIFLTFIQHVQYKITQKTAYISDFQGVGVTLTNPQIMTQPGLGPNLFGEGNVGAAFKKFPEEHQCNHYCEWFELEKLV